MITAFQIIYSKTKRMIASAARRPNYALLAALIVAGATAPRQTTAQDVQRISAIVNEDIISSYDLHQRVTLVLNSLNLPNTAAARAQISRQVLETMINEALQMQEADEFEVEIDNDDIQQAFVDLARRNNQSPKEFVDLIEEQGVEPAVIMRQIQAELLWGTLMRGLWGQRVKIGDEEIDNILTRLEESKGLEEFQVSEIVMLAETPNEQQKIGRTMRRLYDQIMENSPFDAVARQFSQGATSAIGGDVGWIRLGQFPREIDDVLVKLGFDEVSEPIQTPGGWTIIMLRDRRTIPGPSPLRARVQLMRILFVYPDGATADQIAAVKQHLLDVKATPQTCDEVEREMDLNDAVRTSRLGTTQLGELPSSVRNMVTSVEANGFGEPVDTARGQVLLQVCDRQEPPVQLPTRDSIEQNLRQRRVNMMSRRHLRDLRQDAIIDIR